MTDHPPGPYRARAYAEVRTAHLERARAMVRATIFYRRRRYDFDESLTNGLDLVQSGPAATALRLFRRTPRAVEVNEPLQLAAQPAAALAVAAVRTAGFLRRRRTQVVAYAIENRDPRADRLPGWKSRARRLVELAAAWFVAGQLDRICFGTASAQDVYRSVGLRAGAASVLIPALPAACTCPSTDGRDRDAVVFLGAFVERKGLPELLAAWPLVHAARPTATLTVIGQGRLESEARAAAQADPSIHVLVDPPRTEIHARLRTAGLLALLSQPAGRWREQVGLPLVEALSHDIPVVATSETGLAEWLGERGHRVLSPEASPAEAAEAILAGLAEQPPPGQILRSLPDIDGRIAADRWLFGVDTDQSPSSGRLPPPARSDGSVDPQVEIPAWTR